MAINTQHARELLRQFDLRRLFAEELCWASPAPRPIHLDIDGRTYSATSIAEQGGMMVFEVLDAKDGLIPGRDIQLKASRRISKTYAEHILIFVNAARTSSLWLWVKRQDGRYQPRDHRYSRSQAGDSLLQKLAGIAFELEDLDEEGRATIGVVLDRVQAALDIEKVTKRFYEQFKKEHAVFLKFITGITESADHEWYGSVMLNRLMFVYFIQRKGFLDGDRNYLRNRLDRCQQEKGKDKFYSFYRYFLLRLFHEGLGGKTRTPTLEKLLGRIPYLNGGLFEQHQIEKDYPKIEIPDKAFERIFDYFDQYQWHLDERPLRADNEINPDVLGYIFEKYVNQKQMGAYYTKEDITGYISKNTVLPSLFDATRTKCKVAFENPNGPTVWDLLRLDPDRYIYPAVCHGVEKPLPPEIAEGVDTSKPKLIERRKGWNKSAPSEYSLPTETWRELVARRMRYEDIHGKLASGEVREINDLITLNLDIRQFAQDAIENAEGPELLRAFWHAIAGTAGSSGVTILDPTCGSGAFLFAALNILEPLYEACLDRMEAFVADLDRCGEKHRPEKFSDFRKVLAHVAAHPNRRYFIFKSIILNNLFGVDIMEEAVEICKLRLFLKLAAQVEPDNTKDNLGIEPLPDIDFNIRAGNSLVGYATYDEVKRVVTSKLDFDNAMEKISVKAADLQQTFDKFRQLQTEGDGSVPAADKLELQKRLKALEDELNRHLAGEYGVKVSDKVAYAKWLKSHQPFHWFIQFYGILNSGGFDVIIGNPPYVEYKTVVSQYRIRNYITEECGNLYTFVVEKSFALAMPTGRIGLIVPISLTAAQRMATLQDLLVSQSDLLLFANYGLRPAALFPGVMQRLTIFISSKGNRHLVYTSDYITWYADERDALFPLLKYYPVGTLRQAYSVPKTNSQIGYSTLSKILSKHRPWKHYNQFKGGHCVFYHNAGGYWIKTFNFKPFYKSLVDSEKTHTTISELRLPTDELANTYLGVLNSSLFYFFWKTLTDARHVYPSDIAMFPIALPMSKTDLAKITQLGNELMSAFKKNRTRITYGNAEVEQFSVAPTKPILDKIDTVLAGHYGFTAEELDFILNYDIKYRLGRDTENEDDE